MLLVAVLNRKTDAATALWFEVPSFPVANAEASCGEQATSFLLPAVLCQL